MGFDPSTYPSDMPKQKYARNAYMYPGVSMIPLARQAFDQASLLSAAFAEALGLLPAARMD